ncbi:MAG: hypothetical protein GY795_13700 [Desulfobacterales bacterium]|nr:hypothetical protein [Desulfobacterales bacterium]
MSKLIVIMNKMPQAQRFNPVTIRSMSKQKLSELQKLQKRFNPVIIIRSMSKLDVLVLYTEKRGFQSRNHSVNVQTLMWEFYGASHDGFQSRNHPVNVQTYFVWS